MTFWAEQNGDFFALRRIEAYSGSIAAPFSMTGLIVSLPRPPRPGKWNIFAVQEHSDKVYGNHLESHSAKTPLLFVEDQDETHRGMWISPLVSNAITVEFSEIDENKRRSVESVIQGLIDAGQYDAAFREPQDDPTKQWRTPQ